jgi:hypothetical protein
LGGASSLQRIGKDSVNRSRVGALFLLCSKLSNRRLTDDRKGFLSLALTTSNFPSEKPGATRVDGTKQAGDSWDNRPEQ